MFRSLPAPLALALAAAFLPVFGCEIEEALDEREADADADPDAPSKQDGNNAPEAKVSGLCLLLSSKAKDVCLLHGTAPNRTQVVYPALPDFTKSAYIRTAAQVRLRDSADLSAAELALETQRHYLTWFTDFFGVIEVGPKAYSERMPAYEAYYNAKRTTAAAYATLPCVTTDTDAYPAFDELQTQCQVRLQSLTFHGEEEPAKELARVCKAGSAEAFCSRKYKHPPVFSRSQHDFVLNYAIADAATYHYLEVVFFEGP